MVGSAALTISADESGDVPMKRYSGNGHGFSLKLRYINVLQNVFTPKSVCFTFQGLGVYEPWLFDLLYFCKNPFFYEGCATSVMQWGSINAQV